MGDSPRFTFHSKQFTKFNFFFFDQTNTTIPSIHFHKPEYNNTSAMSSDPRLKKLRISTGVVKRCGKEKLSYRKEADMQKEKIEKMKTEGRDEIEIRKMNECMQESLMMIPDCHRRLEKAINEMKPLLEELETEFSESKEVTDAKTALEASEEHLKAE